MQDSAYGPVNTTIRVHENYLLKKSHYDRMLAADDYESAIRVLQDTNYRDEVDEALRTRNYEPMLMQELRETYQWVTDQSPNRQLIELITLAYTYHNIEVLFKENITDNDFSHTLIDIGAFPIYELRRAITLKDSKVLPERYVENIKELYFHFEEMPSLQDLDVYFDRIYFDHMLALAEEINDPKVTNFVLYRLDLNNIAVFFRALAAGQGRNHIQAVLSEGGNLPISFYLDLVPDGINGAVAALRETKFKDIIEKSMVDNQLSLGKLEQTVEDSEMNYLYTAKMDVFGPLPIIAYLNAKETEVKNIRLILTSKLNSIDPAIVRDRMRLNYAV